MKLFSVVILTVAVTTASAAANLDWWKNEVFYQIYPRSFKDNTNDGVGDLLGVIEKLPYIKETGIGAIWLSPIFESPGVDQGYDISDYLKVDPLFGTNEDLETLIKTAHSLGIKVILDFVPNHTSDKHQWFINSENKVDGYEDFYVWHDGKIDENGQRVAPNNWISLFKNTTWEWSEKRQQYYLHQFAIQQPDLNYRNPKVAETMKSVLKFWLDKEVDGFRVDAVPFIFEDPNFEDEPKSGLPGMNDTDYDYLDHTKTFNLQETFDLIYDWREFLDQYTKDNGGDQRIMMTEAYAKDKTMLYYGLPDGSKLGAHFTFNFNMIINVFKNSTAAEIVEQLQIWLDDLPSIYVPNWVLGNHDNPRVATRFGPENVDGFNMLVTLLPGVGVTYNGEEIGQENGEVSYEEGQDPSARDPDTFAQLSRDFERTPFHWDTSINAGFNEGGKPWLPVSEKYLETNLADQVKKSRSHYNNYQFLLQVRKVFKDATTELSAPAEQVVVLRRNLNEIKLVLIFNKGDTVEELNATNYLDEVNVVLLTDIKSNVGVGDVLEPSSIKLQPHESLLLYSL